jgi:hypothetical protein
MKHPIYIDDSSSNTISGVQNTRGQHIGQKLLGVIGQICPTRTPHPYRTYIERPAIQTRSVRFQSAADILLTVNKNPFYV